MLIQGWWGESSRLPYGLGCGARQGRGAAARACCFAYRTDVRREAQARCKAVSGSSGAALPAYSARLPKPYASEKAIKHTTVVFPSHDQSMPLPQMQVCNHARFVSVHRTPHTWAPTKHTAYAIAVPTIPNGTAAKGRLSPASKCRQCGGAQAAEVRKQVTPCAA